jgi:Ca2+-transporting ATPase
MIVKAFKSQNLIVAMTGDGVNDAPSLKAADIGISMGITGTDVAKGASDMTLSDDNFASIEKAVREGRGIYANIKKSVLFLLSSNFGEIMIMFLGIVFKLPVPLLAIHILWVNLITDSLPALALGSDNIDEDIMSEKPRKANESLFAHGGLKLTILYGLLIAFISFAILLSAPIDVLISKQLPINFTNIIQMFKDDEELLKLSRTLTFSTLAICQLFHALGMRNIKRSVFDPKLLGKNKMMFIAFTFGILLQLAVTEIPALVAFFHTTRIDFHYWLIIFAASLIPLIVHEIIYVFNFYHEKRKKAAKKLKKEVS